MGIEIYAKVEFYRMSRPDADKLAELLSKVADEAQIVNGTTYEHPLLERRDKDGGERGTRKMLVFAKGADTAEAQRKLQDVYRWLNTKTHDYDVIGTYGPDNRMIL